MRNFNRLAAVIRLLDVRNADGFVFRVDMRLRPSARAGPWSSVWLSRGLLATTRRDWERYAWIKARAIVGADAYGAAYEEFVRHLSTVDTWTLACSNPCAA